MKLFFGVLCTVLFVRFVVGASAESLAFQESFERYIDMTKEVASLKKATQENTVDLNSVENVGNLMEIIKESKKASDAKRIERFMSLFF